MGETSEEDLLAFVDEALERFDTRVAAAFWALEQPLQEFLQSGGLQVLINRELAALTAAPFHLGNWAQNEIVLYTNDKCSLSLALFDAPRRYIHVLPYFAMYVPISGPLSYDVYELPTAYRNDLFDPALRLHLTSSLTASALSVVRLVSDSRAYDFKITEPVAVLRLTTTTIRPLEWLFSKKTLLAWQANDADLRFTQLRVGASVLGKIAHQSSIEPLKALARHDHHAVRWAAIQNLGRLNRSEALARIREAVSDPHPHVRKAAQMTLERLEGKSTK